MVDFCLCSVFKSWVFLRQLLYAKTLKWIKFSWSIWWKKKVQNRKKKSRNWIIDLLEDNLLVKRNKKVLLQFLVSFNWSRDLNFKLELFFFFLKSTMDLPYSKDGLSSPLFIGHRSCACYRTLVSLDRNWALLVSKPLLVVLSDRKSWRMRYFIHYSFSVLFFIIEEIKLCILVYLPEWCDFFWPVTAWILNLGWITWDLMPRCAF